MATESAEGSLSAYLSFGPKDARADRLRGQKDGRKNLPPAEETSFSPYELEILQEGKIAYTRYVKHRDDDLARLRDTLVKLEHDRDEGYRTQRDAVLRDRGAALENLRGTDGPASALYSRLSNRLQEARTAESKLELQLNRPLRIHFRHTYPFFLAMLSLAEVPINQLAFEFFFQEAPIIALAIALMVGVLLISLAHVCGIWLRQAGHYTTLWARIAAYGATALVSCIVFGLIYFIAALRQQLVDFIEREQNFNLSEFLRSGGGLGQVAEQAATQPLGSASLTLLFINVAIFVFGVVLSFLRHDPHPDYEQVVRTKERTERRLQRRERRFERKSAKLLRGFDEKIAHLDREIDRIEGEIVGIQNRIGKITGRDSDNLTLIATAIGQRILAYQAGNTETRRERYPAYFGETALRDIRERITQP